MSKFRKLLTRKTFRGKMNILIDMTCHGKGWAGYVVDEMLHILNERKFSLYKFVRYGNAKRIFGSLGGAMFTMLYRVQKAMRAFDKKPRR